MDLIRTDFHTPTGTFYDNLRQTVYEAPLPLKIAGSVVGLPVALLCGAELAAVAAVSAGITAVALGLAAMEGAPTETVVRCREDLAELRNPFGPVHDNSAYVRHPKDKALLIPTGIYHETILPEQAADLIDFLKSVGPVTY